MVMIMKKTFSLYLLTACLFSLLIFNACDKPSGNVIRIGAILTLSGPVAPYGQDNLKGIQLAQGLINENGGIAGRKVEIDVQDDAGDPAQATALARQMASNNNIIAIIGLTRTGSTVAVAKLLPTLQIPLMSVGSTGDWKSASGGDFNDWTFRSTKVDTYIIEPLLRTARDDFGIKRVAIFYTANDDWAVSVTKVYESKINELGLQLVAKESQMSGDADRSPQLTKIKAANPDAIVVNCPSGDAITMANQARDLGIKNPRFIGTAAFNNPSNWNLAKPGVLDGVLVAENFYSGSPRPAVREFNQRYKTKYGAEPPPYAAYAYDGMMLLAEAAKKAGNPPDRRALRDALGSIQNFEGVLGKITYKGKGDADKDSVILRIEQGHYILVK